MASLRLCAWRLGGGGVELGSCYLALIFGPQDFGPSTVYVLCLFTYFTTSLRTRSDAIPAPDLCVLTRHVCADLVD